MKGQIPKSWRQYLPFSFDSLNKRRDISYNVRDNNCIHGVIGMKAFYQTHLGNLFVGDMTQSPFPLHVHETLEVSYLYTGTCDMLIDGKPCTIHAGDLAITFPLVPHSFEQLTTDCSGLVIFFQADSIEEYSAIFHKQLPVSPILRASQLSEDARFALDRLAGMKGREQEGTTMRLAYLHLLLAHLVGALEYRPADTLNERGLADRVIKYIYDHACESITLSSTARGLGISESHLSHLFSQQFHVNFRRFVNAIRIDKAESLLRDPTTTLTAVCYGCGFENMRTFRRAFVRETGLLPTEYLQKMRGEVALNAPIEA